jgi:hypothetical protein
VIDRLVLELRTYVGLYKVSVSIVNRSEDAEVVLQHVSLKARLEYTRARAPSRLSL